LAYLAGLGCGLKLRRHDDRDCEKPRPGRVPDFDLTALPLVQTSAIKAQDLRVLVCALGIAKISAAIVKRPLISAYQIEKEAFHGYTSSVARRKSSTSLLWFDKPPVWYLSQPVNLVFRPNRVEQA
jgi:hypothetical protein